MALGFRVLGPLEVVVDGRVVPVSAPRQQAVLASLVLRANQLVPVERLVGELWAEDPPANAEVAVRMAVSRLRRLLGAGVLVTGAGGYLLRVDLDQVDAHRFERLAAEGRAALEEGAAERAAELLRAALGLWRGPVVSGARPTAAVAAEATRLELERLSVLEARVDAELACGRHVEVLGELESLVGEHPLRERLWGQLMVALYRSGRQAQALEAFQQLRRRLVGELGIEPGPELARLHQAVLRHDPELQPSGPSAPEAERGRPPAQLPADLADFTGREDDLARLDRLADSDRGGAAMVISAIEGMGGIGKSALAIHAAHRLAPRFPDGQLYVNLQGATAGLAPLEPLEVLGRFLRALGVAGGQVPGEVAEAAAMFRSVVAGRRLLVVLDNAADVAQVAPLLPGVPTCGVLVTSRRVLASLDGAVHLHLDVLAPEEATALLGRLAGAERVAAEPEAAASVARLCGFLPLALRIAGARLAARPGWSLRVLADRLGDERERLAELELAERGVRASLAVSYEALRSSGDATDRAAADAFGLLGVPDGPDFGVPVVARLLDRDEPASEALLERLVDAQLLETASPGRYRMHDLMRLYARELAARHSPEADRTAALTRALAFFIATGWQILALLRPGHWRLARVDDRWTTGGLAFGDESAAVAWLEAERTNLVAAIKQSASVEGAPSEMAIQLARVLSPPLLLCNYWDDLELANRVALEAARRTDDPAARSEILNDLGVVYWRRGRYEEAVASHRHSLAIRTELGDRRGQGASLTNLGLVYERLGRYQEALDCHQRSLAIGRELGDRDGQASALTNVGLVYERLGRYQEALDCHQQSLAISQEMGFRLDEANNLVNIGLIHERCGRYEQALACHRMSLAICQELGDRRGQSESLTNLGAIYGRLRRHEEALSCLRESSAICQELGDRPGQAEALQQLGVVLQALGRTREARTHWQRAVTIFEELHSPAADEIRALLTPSSAERL